MAGSVLEIQCNPDIECSKTGTITSFDNIYPGFQTSRKIVVTNNRNDTCELSLAGHNKDTNHPIYKYAKISFSGQEINFASSNEILIDTLAPKQKKDINVRFYVSTKADNSFANQSETLDFNFKINCIPVSSSSGTVAGISTNKSFCSCFWWWFFILVAILVFIFTLRLAKKQE